MSFQNTLEDIRPTESGATTSMRRGELVHEHYRSAVLTGIAVGGTAGVMSGSVALGVALTVATTIAFGRWLRSQGS